MILLIDNYDSFTFNLKRYLVRLGQDVAVCRNDDPALSELASESSAILLSPGPKAPRDAGHSIEITREFSGQKPILGICLGHQVIGESFGAKIERSGKPTHGKASLIELVESPLFEGIESPCSFARYHSLIVSSEALPQELNVIARLADGTIMALQHSTDPTFGVQFHPESVLSTAGYQLLSNFLKVAGLPQPSELPSHDCTNIFNARHSSDAAGSSWDEGSGRQLQGSDFRPDGKEVLELDDHGVVLPGSFFRPPIN